MVDAKQQEHGSLPGRPKDHDVQLGSASVADNSDEARVSERWVYSTPSHVGYQSRLCQLIGQIG
jgi:hypothetical protein